MIEASVSVAPPPPYSSGIRTDSQPFLVNVSTNSSGYLSGSNERQYSPGKSAHNAAMAERKSSCPVLVIKSINYLYHYSKFGVE